MSRTAVFIIRAILGAAGGIFLWRVFYPQATYGWFIALVLAVLVVVSAYLSEAWRRKREE
jgi:hypothetical protein